MTFDPFVPASGFPRFTNKSGAWIQGSFQLSTLLVANGQLRLTPITIGQACTLQGLGAEFTVAGDAPSVFLPVIFSDDGTGYPGALLSSPGSISTGSGNAGTVPTGGTPGVYLVPATIPIAPGVYWWGGVPQGVTVTAPTMRTGVADQSFIPGSTSQPGAGASILGYQQAGVTGAIPAQFPAFNAATQVFSCPRIIAQIR